MEGPVRRLAAVWFADLVGYTELSSRDESTALALVEILQEVTSDLVERHQGRVVKFIGDAVLADFTSTEAAVEAALAVRDAFQKRAREKDLPGALRIGVHVGEVVRAPDGDLYGDGVNTASRLEREAGPGEVVVSHAVWNQLRQRTQFAFEALGMHELKGLASPIALFRALRPGEAETDPARARATSGGRRRKPGAFLAVVALYLVVGLVILQATGIVRNRFDLPAWVTPVAGILLVIGLLVVSATAWVRSRETTTAPAWEIDFQDLMESLVERRVPTLTWGRTLAGGALAFAFLFVVAGGTVYWQSGGRFGLSPREARGDAGPRIAVLPFQTRGPGAEVYEEGMVDLLSLDLGGVPGIRVADPLAVLGRWKGAGSPRDTAGLFELARSRSARYALTGSAARSRDSLHLTIAVHDLEEAGRPMREIRIAASADSLPSLLDRARARILEGDLVPAEGWDPAEELKARGTSSLPALLAYARGQRHLRSSEWDRAAEEFQAAVDADDGFALALYRLSMTRRWAADALPHRAFADAEAERAAELAGELPEKESLLVRGYWHLTRGRAAAIDTLRTLTDLYPDLAEGWFHLGDAYYHLGDRVGAPPERFREAFRRAIDVDPTFGRAYLHLIDDARARQDTARGRRLLEEFRDVDPGNPILAGYDLANAFGSRDVGSREEGGRPDDTPTSDLRSEYEEVREEIQRARRSAREDGATTPDLQDGDSFRAEAIGSARAGDYASALTKLEMARTAYVDAARSARWSASLDAARIRLDDLREGADPGSEEAAEAERLVERASEAERSERFQDALTLLADAAEAYRRAPPAGDEDAGAGGQVEEREEREEGIEPEPDASEGPAPSEAPSPPPEEIVEATLERLRSAQVSEDADALKRVWVSLDDEALENWRNFFANVRDLAVSYEVRSLERTETGLRARVGRTREYVDPRGDEVRNVGDEAFELERRGDDWVIVSIEEIR